MAAFVRKRLMEERQQIGRAKARGENLGGVDEDGAVLAAVIDPQDARRDRRVPAPAQDLRLSTKSTLALRISASWPNGSRWARA